jgi:polysaccharide pyruvyl transferase WcaK-like protein
MPKNVGLVNVAYSPNLGDGVIAECLSAILLQHFGWRAHNVDIAGRHGFGEAPRRSLMLRTLSTMPPPVRRASVRLALAVKHMRDERPLTNPADLVLVGGGQLLQDDDLNFPLKLRRVLNEAAKLKIPVAVVSAGVAGTWSDLGLSMIREALAKCDVIAIGLRDPGSLSNWKRLFGDLALPQAQLCPDPAIGIATLMPELRRQGPREGPARIGVNITNPMVLARHGRTALPSHRDALAAWAGLVRAIATSGRTPVMFTNGSPEDEEFLSEVMAALGTSSTAVRLRKAANPIDLVRAIAGLDALFAYRLHAAIVGVSYDVPVIGFRWDDKLAAFFEYAGLGEFAMDLHSTPAGELLAAVDRAADARYDAVRARMRDSSQDLLVRFLAQTLACCDNRPTKAETALHVG